MIINCPSCMTQYDLSSSLPEYKAGIVICDSCNKEICVKKTLVAETTLKQKWYQKLLRKKPVIIPEHYMTVVKLRRE